MTGGCSFSVCSLITDVRESVSEIPREPEDVKAMLMEHLGFANSNANANSSVKTDVSAGLVATTFKHPISYTDPEKLHELPVSIIDDLEMITAKVAAMTVKGLYHYVFSPTSVYGTEHLPIWSKYYTTDIEYLKHTQTLLEMFDNQLLERCITQNTGHLSSVEAFAVMKDTWKDFRGTGKIADFKEKFSYVETPFLSKLNGSSSFLQFLSIYNISSPVIALLTPLIVLIIPFFVLMMRGIAVTISEYIDILKTIISQHSVGRFLTQFDTVSVEQKMYILMSVVFYGIQVYQNIMACIRFYNNIKLVHTHIHTINGYLTATGINMSYMIQLIHTYHLSSYDPFREELAEKYALVEEVTRALSDISPFSVSVSKFFQIGYVMKNYYSLFSQTDLNELLEYSFGFNAYIEHLTACRSFVVDGTIHACSFVEPEAEPEPEADADADADAEAEPEAEPEAENTRPLTPIPEDDSEANVEAEALLPPPPPEPAVAVAVSVVKKTRVTKLISQVYAPLRGAAPDTVIANDIVLDKQLVITGPNAAGKTTVIKSTLFNIILSQQIGYGFYERAEITPYDYLHCYLNIPDTSGRDSLFQEMLQR